MINPKEPISSNQIGALISIVIIAVWGVWVLWWHMIRPLGMKHIEMLFLVAIVPISLALIPLYWFRIRWSYISGVLVLVGLLAGFIKSFLENGLDSCSSVWG